MNQYPLNIIEGNFKGNEHLTLSEFVDKFDILEKYKDSPWLNRILILNQRLAKEGDFRYFYKPPLLPEADSFNKIFDTKNIRWYDYFKTHKYYHPRISGVYLDAPETLFNSGDEKLDTAYVDISDELREAWERVNGPVSGPDTSFTLNTIRVYDWDSYWAVWGNGSIVQSLITLIKKG